MLLIRINSDHIVTSSSTIGKAMFRMLAALAELERELIVERAQNGPTGSPQKGPLRVDGKVVERALKLYDSKEYRVA